MKHSHVQYWMDPSQNLWSLGLNNHNHITDLVPELKPQFCDQDYVSNEVCYKLVDSGWVRVTYDCLDHRLSVHAQKSYLAQKCIKQLLSKENLCVQELFLDINNLKIRRGLSGVDLQQYITRGRLPYQDQQSLH